MSETIVRGWQARLYPTREQASRLNQCDVRSATSRPRLARQSPLNDLGAVRVRLARATAVMSILNLVNTRSLQFLTDDICDFTAGGSMGATSGRPGDGGSGGKGDSKGGTQDVSVEDGYECFVAGCTGFIKTFPYRKIARRRAARENEAQSYCGKKAAIEQFGVPAAITEPPLRRRYAPLARHPW